MRNIICLETFILLLFILPLCVLAQEKIVVRPRVIDDVLINPGIGFTTSNRLNYDDLKSGDKWIKARPAKYDDVDGKLNDKNYPICSIAYFQFYWKALEPEKGKYNWAVIDDVIKKARKRRQTLLLRVAPYGYFKNDVPSWYTKMVGVERKLPLKKWRVDPENPLYLRFFGGLIRAFGKRYDGLRDIESVDIAIVGAWGEGKGTALLTSRTRKALLDCYLDSFKKTPLLIQLTDKETIQYALSKADIGWRADCLGDMGGFSGGKWSHMNDWYPRSIINFGLRDAWKKAPVAFEVGWDMRHWMDKGWDIERIIDESLKWHISSLNAKSSPVPVKWWPAVNRWLKKMGYRFELRKFTYPAICGIGKKLVFTSWWDNTGVAPCYGKFALALRLKRLEKTFVLLTDVDIRGWLPGDNLYDSSVTIPNDVPPGEYDLQIGIVDRRNLRPRIKLAVAGREPDGWYTMGKISIRK